MSDSAIVRSRSGVLARRVPELLRRLSDRTSALRTLSVRVPELLVKLKIRSAALRILYGQERNSLVSHFISSNDLSFDVLTQHRDRIAPHLKCPICLDIFVYPLS